MLEIRFNSQPIELPDDFQIIIVEHGNVFTFDKLEGGYSLPVSAPMSVRNQRIFGFAFRPEKHENEVIEGDAEVIFHGIPIARGIMRAEEISQKSIEFTIFVNNGGFYHQIKDKLLTDLDYGDDCEFILPTFAENGTRYPQRYVLATIQNEDFFKDTIYENYKTVEGGVWKDAFEKQNTVNSIESQAYEFFFKYNYPVAVTPFPFVDDVLYKVLSNFITLYESKVSDNQFLTWFPKQLLFTVNTIVYARHEIDFGTYNAKNHVPRTPVTEFLLSIQNFWNLFLNVRHGHAILISRYDMIMTESYIDYSSKHVKTTTKKITGKADGWEISVQRDSADSFASNYPDFSQSQHSHIELPSLEYYPVYGNYTVYDTIGFARFTYRMDHTKTLVFFENPPGIYSILSQGEEWQVLPEGSGNFQEFRNVAISNGMFSGNLDVKIPLFSCSISHWLYGQNQSNLRALPIVKQKGNFFQGALNRNGTEYPYNDFSLRYMFHFSNDMTALPFRHIPYAASGYFFGVPPSGDAPEDEKDTISYSAQWSYYERWKKFLTWYLDVDAEYTIYLYMNAADIFNFDFTKKYKIGENTYFITDLEYNLSNNGVSVVKATAIRF